MKTVKDHSLDVPGEANRDKHINFLAIEEGDADSTDNKNETDEPADEADNGFFTNDNETEAKKNSGNGKEKAGITSEKIIPAAPDATQAINDSVPEGDNNSTSVTGNNRSSDDDDQAH